MFFLQMSGYPGSGKSTLAKIVAEHTTAIILDHDIVKSSLLESLNGIIDFKKVGKVSYDVEWALIDYYLAQGRNVILDSPCIYSEMIEKGLNLTQKYKAKYKYVECYLNDFKEINDRLKNRKRMISQIEQAPSEDALIETIKRSKKPPETKIHIVDTSRPIESYVDSVIRYINE